MLFVLSPAKNLNEQDPAPISTHTQPELLAEAEQLMAELKRLAPQDIATLMHVSDKIALLNTERNAAWHTPFTPANAKQAIYLFNGDVYEGVAANTLPETGINYLQQHLRLLSGLYGLLRPLDLIQPYRLEMGTKFVNTRGKNLYEYWGERITNALNNILTTQPNPTLINLASQEYFKSVKPIKLNTRIITPVFKDEKNGQYKIISFYAKKARGMMSRFVIKERINDPEQLKQFDAQGYYYSAEHSKPDLLVFLRDHTPE